jgi:hypothetical protein
MNPSCGRRELSPNLPLTAPGATPFQIQTAFAGRFRATTMANVSQRETYTISNFAMTMVSARPAMVHSLNAGSDIIASM